MIKPTEYRLPFAAIVATLAVCSPVLAQETSPSPTAPVTPKPSPAVQTSPKPSPSSVSKPIADTKKRLEVEITLTDGVKVIKTSRQSLGFSLVSDAPVQFAVDKAKLKAGLSALAGTFQADAIDAKPFIYKGAFSVKPSQAARSLNVPTTAEKIEAEVKANPATVKFRVALNKKAPVLTAERLQGISGKLSQFSSVAVGTANRDTNIAVAVNSINGTLLSPGETFSLNKTVGQRTESRGFKTAHVFVDAKVVDGVGGGVSQVTGTLFNAAALAGLKINEVNPHSRPVAYLPLGRDATVAYGAKDLRFTNNTDAPVYIIYSFVKSRLTATLWGKPVPGRVVSLRPAVQRLGEGKINAQLYRVFKENGKVIGKERLLSHAYRWKPGEDNP